MTIAPTKLPGVFVITPNVHEDNRGFLMESYRKDLLAGVGITDDFVQDNHARSLVRNTVRGLHFQWSPPAAKLMRATRGAAFLVAVDVRKNSPTFGEWFGIESSEDNRVQLYAPAGCARGYQTLTDTCEVQYKVSALYNPEGQGEIAWNDPDISIDWPIKEPPFLSPRTEHGTAFKEWVNDSRLDAFSL